MHCGGDVVLAKRALQRELITEVGLDERTPLHCPAVPCREVIEYDWLKAGAVQRLGRMTADVARSASDENSQ